MSAEILPHVFLSTDQLACLEINGYANCTADNGEVINVKADDLTMTVEELADPMNESEALGDGYTVSA